MKYKVFQLEHLDMMLLF